ncbi:MAG: hypothetical protein RLZZ408_545, partial [Verrucomicrobiota bacterium]
MTPETVPFGGWNNCLRLSNAEAELIVTLDVGPRILSYRRPGGANVLKNYQGQLGGCGEKEWMIRGGHRLWIAPEDELLSYHLDNEPVSRVSEGEGRVTISSRMASPHPLRKDLSITLADKGSRVDLLHSITNEGSTPITLATWALTVMAPGGTEIIPQPPLGEHPRDLLPNRTAVLWPYTDLSDPRWKLGRSYFLLRQQADGTPTKIGLAHGERWVGYLLGEDLFLKTFPLVKGAPYPDGGCNFETFTNADMLEIESLGPLATLQPGESTSHP